MAEMRRRVYPKVGEEEQEEDSKKLRNDPSDDQASVTSTASSGWGVGWSSKGPDNHKKDDDDEQPIEPQPTVVETPVTGNDQNESKPANAYYSVPERTWTQAIGGAVVGGTFGVVKTVVGGAAKATTSVVAGAMVGGVPGAIGGLAATTATGVVSMAYSTAKLGVTGVALAGGAAARGISYAVSKKQGDPINDKKNDEANVSPENLSAPVTEPVGTPRRKTVDSENHRNHDTNQTIGSLYPDLQAAHDNISSSDNSEQDVKKTEGGKRIITSPNSCTDCGHSFSIVTWKYPCPNCEKVFCGSCLNNTQQHRIPRLHVIEPVAMCQTCFVSICAPCCGGKCFSEWPGEKLKLFMKSKEIDFVRGSEREDLVRTLNEWASVDNVVSDRMPPISSAMKCRNVEYMSVANLRKALDAKGIDHSRCVEKRELVSLLRSTE